MPIGMQINKLGVEWNICVQTFSFWIYIMRFK